jgi:hydroxymethylpyrimidine pyrophosphatase-like HAD family hydrolase
MNILYHSVFFIEIGASDGIYNDLLYPYITKHDWEGILVEPNRDMFLKLINNYNGYYKLYFENIAVSENYSRKNLYMVNYDKYKRELTKHISSLDRTNLIRHKVPERDIISKEVECVPYDHLLKKYFVKKYDILYLNTEGYNRIILSQAVRCNPTPKIILYETERRLNEEVQEIENLLSRYDYNIIKTKTHNYHFKNEKTNINSSSNIEE